MTSQTPLVTDAPLDVARLARALDNGLQLGQPWISDVVPYDDFLMECARTIAAEYEVLRLRALRASAPGDEG